MSVTVNASQANKLFRSAITDVNQNSWTPNSLQSKQIEDVILGTHLTYRYILTTGLIAKATNESCNALTLQAGSSLQGAYDARSICHGVLVPIERELLGGRLGESNEPFLNKPARYPELSTLNAVRRGNDARLLETTIGVLSSLTSSEHAYQCLKDCVYYILQRKSRNLSDYLISSDSSLQQTSLIRFADGLLSQSFEGETCALLVGATYNVMGLAQSRSFDVKVHKVNQAGSSSKEVSDVDVYENGMLIHTIEVKDKAFTPEDVQHAINKAVMSGSKSLVFAVGPRGALRGSSWAELTQLWSQQGVNLYFVNVLDHFVSTLSSIPSIDIRSVLDVINYHADQSKVKDDTFEHLVQCSKAVMA
ncbi:hypothetical protein BJG01_09920 [Vibrio splendidus]|nr:hypothetical protein BJG01_09920 [Vibrio splendidus]URM14696.1 restriction endonuclease, SacI family [Vibrio splendidus]